MKDHSELRLISKEYQALLKVLKAEEERIGRPLTLKEENDLLIPLIDLELKPTSK